jgi:glutamate carboxypeptidase
VSLALELLHELCALDAPTGDPDRLVATEELLAARLDSLGARVERHAGGHLEARFGPDGARPVLVLCHYDTVWPRGTAAARPLRVEDGVAHGPGVFDMRGGIAAVFEALGRQQPARPATVLLTSDEESGSRSSRPLLERLGREAAVVLVPEPPLPGGGLKSSRSGGLTVELRVHGRAAHAGLDPDAGVSAVHELARLVRELEQLARPRLGTRVNVGVVAGGTQPNVVAAEARAEVDLRVRGREEEERLTAALERLAPSREGLAIELERTTERPVMERTPAIAGAVARARELAAGLGQVLEDGHAGGGSDGNFLAPLGIAVVDGLGPDGGGAHAEHEHVLLEALAQRVELLAHLIARF